MSNDGGTGAARARSAGLGAGRWLDWLAAGWGFAEATFFFVVPDVLFTRTMIASLKRGWWQFALAIAGALADGAVIYLWASASPAQTRGAVARVPFLGEKIITPAEERWNTEGTASLFRNPLSGVPYKVHAILAPAHLSLPRFLLLSVPLRAERMLLSMIVFVPLSVWINRGPAERARARQTIGYWFHGAFWTIVYVVYWSINYS